MLAPATSITRILSTSTKARAAAHRASLSVSDKTLEGDCCVGYSYTAGTLIEDIRPCGEQAYSTSTVGIAPYSTPSGMRGTTPKSTQARHHDHLPAASQLPATPRAPSRASSSKRCASSRASSIGSCRLMSTASSLPVPAPAHAHEPLTLPTPSACPQTQPSSKNPSFTRWIE